MHPDPPLAGHAPLSVEPLCETASRAADPLLVTGARPWRPGAPTWALTTADRVLDAGTGAPPADVEPRTRIDAAGRTLAPSFTDIHCHGGGGASAEEGGVETLLRTHRGHGTGLLVLSLVSNPVEEMAATAARIASEARRLPGFAGIHLEGPCLSPTHKGAHDLRHLARPSARALEPVLEAAEGLVRQVTLAPELDDGLEATRFLVENGIAVGVGHTGADYATASAAFDAGASLLTHAFNAMPGLHHRTPGPVAAALDASHVTLELIADGVHVHPAMIRLLFAAAPGRVALVTDAMAAAGQHDGTYRLGGLAVEVTDGVARLAGTETIAGSTLTMDRAVAVAAASGAPLSAALEAATTTPARALGLDASAAAGGIAAGAPAPLLVAMP
ncbi:N-acetylglucosamine-6-phosphate deacetylase [Arthrobacter sp. UM1]|uniref:N-acetylglucosamine-6-phosphate deacetylase n=1 Tax=Arthrobacter sp. UM1 TaxID=2766776 RepID=UPI001CF6D2F1|nr:N-acetylglucosamine-6-phosphate deacetylase [Arthrobacter sp. UM1]MCB4208255.1 N-acetylglucosamine-6-phosphate deacetylase [Arthrobacter sp. UM1]